MRTLTTNVFLSLLLALGAAACSDDGGNGNDPDVDAAVNDTDAPPNNNPMGGECSDVFCFENIITDMSLHFDRTSAGTVLNADDNGDWVSTIDATAGGFLEANNNAFLYMRFTQDGLEKIDIDDETALESMDWDIAARRYVVRLNGGTSGSSCVGAASLPGMLYADITEVPAGTVYAYDQSYDNTCAALDDGSGLPGSPAVALKEWWEYPASCVATTNTPFVIELADGSVVKFLMESYYETDQQVCNDTGTSPGTPSAMLTARWQFLP